MSWISEISKNFAEAGSADLNRVCALGVQTPVRKPVTGMDL